MSIPVLTYHSCNILGNDYDNNDHVALADDLEQLHQRGYRVVDLHEAVQAGLAGSKEKLVALTFDDGPIFDFEDFEHPTCGPQKSFRNLLAEFSARAGYRAGGSAFVIVSPQAREEMDRVDFGARDWWHDRWWREAAADGYLTIENHSWDHNHPSLSSTAQKNNQRGDFRLIDTEEECEAEVDQAARYLEQRAGHRSRYFAYPWGQSSDYLRESYLPTRGPQLGIAAAFGIDPAPLTVGALRWNLPRYVCGLHWTSPEGLASVLGA